MGASGLGARAPAGLFVAVFIFGAGGAGCTDDELLADVCGAYAFEGSGSARVFAVQPRIEPEHFASHEAYRGHLTGLIDKNVKPCLAGDRPNLIMFPEDIGLPAGFIGSRAQKARNAEYIAEALFYLPETYAGPIDHYRSIWPDLELVEGLQLALTDTIWRAFYETMRDIAVETGAHVVASANVSGSIERSEDPLELAALADPDLPGSSYVYVARDRAIYNTAFVWSPSGEIIAKIQKPYLVESEEQQLLLTYGALRDAAPVDLGFARLGVLTSKDAWMPDMVDRLAALGADVLVQPEAFSGWGIEEMPGDWLPDVVLQSGWAAVQKHGAYRYAVIPHLTGNLFDLVFDGQSAIIGDAAPGEAIHAYVGQPPQGGFVAVAPWVVADPGVLDPALPLEERRASLRMAGAALAPGGANENGYIEAVIAADIDPRGPLPVEPDGDPGALGPSALMAESPSGEQVAPALATDGSMNVVAAWQDDRSGAPQIYIARSTDGGETFGVAKPVAPSASAQITPAVGVIGSFVYVAWQERDAGSHIVVAVSSDAGQSFGPAAPVSGGGAAPDEWKPALATNPSGDLSADVLLAFVSGSTGNERVMVARAASGDNTWQVSPADADAPAFNGVNIRNNQWSPSIAIQPNGEVAVAWADFRTYNWDIVLARSVDGGQTFGPAARIDDGTEARERIHNDPALLFHGPDGALLAAWTDVRLRKAFSRARIARAPAGTFSESVALGSAPLDAHTYRPRLTPLDTGDVAIVWQDFRSLTNDIYLAVSPDAGASFAPELRIDDGGPRSNQYAPAIISLSGGRVVIAWEDTRTGARRVRFVAGAP